MNKGIQKKTPSKLYLNTNSNLKGQAQKNDLLSSTEESTKE